MIFGFEAWIFWLILMIAFLIIEAVSFNLTTIWFAAGCLAAIILALIGLPVFVQTVVMIAVSGLLLALFIIFIKPRFSVNAKNIIPTNADRLIGVDALVIEPIDPIGGTGLIKARGQIWSAVSKDEQPIAKTTLVVIVEIRGAKAVVQLKTDE